jgi:hypothetical protein
MSIKDVLSDGFQAIEKSIGMFLKYSAEVMFWAFRFRPAGKVENKGNPKSRFSVIGCENWYVSMVLYNPCDSSEDPPADETPKLTLLWMKNPDGPQNPPLSESPVDL